MARKDVSASSSEALSTVSTDDDDDEYDEEYDEEDADEEEEEEEEEDMERHAHHLRRLNVHDRNEALNHINASTLPDGDKRMLAELHRQGHKNLLRQMDAHVGAGHPVSDQFTASVLQSIRTTLDADVSALAKTTDAVEASTAAVLATTTTTTTRKHGGGSKSSKSKNSRKKSATSTESASDVKSLVDLLGSLPDALAEDEKGGKKKKDGWFSGGLSGLAASVASGAAGWASAALWKLWAFIRRAVDFCVKHGFPLISWILHNPATAQMVLFMVKESKNFLCQEIGRFLATMRLSTLVSGGDASAYQDAATFFSVASGGAKVALLDNLSKWLTSGAFVETARAAVEPLLQMGFSSGVALLFGGIAAVGTGAALAVAGVATFLTKFVTTVGLQAFSKAAERSIFYTQVQECFTFLREIVDVGGCYRQAQNAVEYDVDEAQRLDYEKRGLPVGTAEERKQRRDQAAEALQAQAYVGGGNVDLATLSNVALEDRTEDFDRRRVADINVWSALDRRRDEGGDSGAELQRLNGDISEVLLRLKGYKEELRLLHAERDKRRQR